MTKKDEVVFAKAFEKMEAKGYFVKLREKAAVKRQAKPTAIKAAPKQRRQTAADSVSRMAKIPLAAQKR